MKINLSELRPKLTSVLKQVEAGETVQIVRQGVVIAHIVPPVEQLNISVPITTPEGVKQAGKNIQRIQDIMDREMGVTEAKRKDQARLDLLRGVNRKPR
jgi:prevent-host-death family protein